jgi:hypothetical protein
VQLPVVLCVRHAPLCTCNSAVCRLRHSLRSGRCLIPVFALGESRHCAPQCMYPPLLRVACAAHCMSSRRYLCSLLTSRLLSQHHAACRHAPPWLTLVHYPTQHVTLTAVTARPLLPPPPPLPLLASLLSPPAPLCRPRSGAAADTGRVLAGQQGFAARAHLLRLATGLQGQSAIYMQVLSSTSSFSMKQMLSTRDMDTSK